MLDVQGLMAESEDETLFQEMSAAALAAYAARLERIAYRVRTHLQTREWRQERAADGLDRMAQLRECGEAVAGERAAGHDRPVAIARTARRLNLSVAVVDMRYREFAKMERAESRRQRDRYILQRAAKGWTNREIQRGLERYGMKVSEATVSRAIAGAKSKPEGYTR